MKGGGDGQRGILYFAKGDAFVKEALVSAERTQEVMPDYPITLVADQHVTADCFDNVVLDETPFEKADKPRALRRSPYDRTLYLDTDIWLLEPVPELFEILDVFEIAMWPGEGELHIPVDENGEYVDGVPAAMPEYNSGVIPYQQTPAVESLFDDWEARCSPDHEWDQRALRPALYHSDVRFTALTSSYNCYYQKGGEVAGMVRVGHSPLSDRGDNIIEPQRMMNQLNATDEWRVFRGYRGNVVLLNVPLHRKAQIGLQRLYINLTETGVRDTLSTIGRVTKRAVTRSSVFSRD